MTLRIIFCVLALTLLALLYLVLYRRTRARYAGWWCLSEATVSYGIAPLEYGLDLEAVMARADAALYRAKDAGRDRAMHHRG